MRVLILLLSISSLVLSKEANNSISAVEIRVAVVAPTQKKYYHDQGFLVRTTFLEKYLHNTTKDGKSILIFKRFCGPYNRDMGNVRCDEFDMIIHTQMVCQHAITKCTRVAHVLDLQDRLRFSGNKNADAKLIPLYNKLDGEALMTGDAVKKFCTAKHCLRLTTSFDLQRCEKIVRSAQISRRVKADKNLVVGIVGNAPVYGTLAHSLTAANITFISESGCRGSVHCTCWFYKTITLAVAWSPYIVTNMSLQLGYHRVIAHRNGTVKFDDLEDWHRIKPAERFTNPLFFDIPTIGYSNYSAYQEYGNELLCNTDECVLECIKRIQSGSMNRTIFETRKRVVREVNPRRMADICGTFIADTVAWKQSRLGNATNNTTEVYWSKGDDSPQRYYNMDY